MTPPKKRSGRPKGSLNKISVDTRQSLAKMFMNEIITLAGRMDELSLKDRLDFVLRIAPYIIPKVESVDLVAEEKRTNPKEQVITLKLGNRIETHPWKPVGRLADSL